MSNAFVPFELEQIQAEWLGRIEIDLSESGVHPMSMRELVQDPAELDTLLDGEITYPPVKGDP
jgi:hypothetical protein